MNKTHDLFGLSEAIFSDRSNYVLESCVTCPSRISVVITTESRDQKDQDARYGGEQRGSNPRHPTHKSRGAKHRALPAAPGARSGCQDSTCHESMQADSVSESVTGQHVP